VPNLTTTFIQKVPLPVEGYKIYWDDRKDPRGLGLRVNPKGVKSFVFQFRLRGVSTVFTLGRFGDLTEHQAREEARQIRDGLRKGIDPRLVRRRAEGITLLELAKEYVARPTVNMKPRSRETILRHVQTTFEDMADKPIAAITQDYVRRKYDRLLKHGLRGDRSEGSPGSAKQAYAVLTAMMSYAVEEQRGIEVNPCAKVVNRHNRVKLDERESYIQQSRIGHVWNWLMAERAVAYTQLGMGRLDLLTFLLLTGCRLSEATELQWQNVNLDDADPWWHLPDPKNRQPYWVPLATQALEMLKVRRLEVPQNVPWVFPSSRSKSGHMEDPRDIWPEISKLAEEPITAHDLRRSFTTYGLMECGIDLFRIELLTTHKPTGTVARHYARAATQKLQWLRPQVQQIADWIENRGLIVRSANVIELPMRKTG
jgi:integrase